MKRVSFMLMVENRKDTTVILNGIIGSLGVAE